jgi:hypothetical protein
VIARGVGEAAGALVAPPIAVGMAQRHLGFSGSVTLRPSTLIAVLRDIVEITGETQLREILFSQRAWWEHRHGNRRLFRDLCCAQPRRSSEPSRRSNAG